jgi:hypothetical protein
MGFLSTPSSSLFVDETHFLKMYPSSGFAAAVISVSARRGDDLKFRTLTIGQWSDFIADIVPPSLDDMATEYPSIKLAFMLISLFILRSIGFFS